MLFTTACGKKAEVKDNSQKGKSSNPTLGELYFNALKVIKKAVSNNDVATLKNTVRENPDVDLNQILDDGETFLILAIKKDFREIRNFFIERGVNYEKRNVNNETPLMVAVKNGFINSTNVLLDLKADLEKKNQNGETALHLAIKKSNDEIALLLIKQGASVESKDYKDQNAFTLAKIHNVPKTLTLIQSFLKVEQGAPDTATFIAMLNQADLNRLNQVVIRYPSIVKDYEDLNPLALLVDAKDRINALKSALLLIDNSANINGPKSAELTPLLKATLSQRGDFAQLYLTSNADPQLQDKKGKSALIHAVELNNLELVNLLLSHSAAEKYTFRRNGKKITINACSIARLVEERLQKPEEREINKKIRISLDCRFFNWPT